MLKAGRAALDQLREDRASLSSELAKLHADLEYLEASCLAEVNVEAQVLRADAEIGAAGPARSLLPKRRPAAA
jgi:chromosome segregation protein